MPIKAEVFRHEKQNPTGTTGDAIRAARMQAGLTRKQLSQACGIHIYSLKEGINDGFLTPFRVKQIQTTIDYYVYTPGVTG